MAEKSVIANLETRVRQLIGDHERVTALCAELAAERDALRSENRTLRERVKTLDAEVARLELAGGLTGDRRDRDKARARVNRLMREVDKCIALLNSPADGGQEADREQEANGELEAAGELEAGAEEPDDER